MAPIQEEIGYTLPNLSKDMEQVYIGAMGWHYSFWPLYENTSSKDYLVKYSEKFNSVEINSTFYRIPRKSSVLNWKNQTPDNFTFSIKIPKSISHSQSLKYNPEKLNIFLDNIKPLKEKLGPLLIQLPPRLKPKESEQLKNLLNHLHSHRNAIEFRHKDWYNEAIYKLLRDYNTALVYVEHPFQTSNEVETSNFTYIRLEGDRNKIDGEKGVSEKEQLKNNFLWSDKIKDQLNRGRATYLYISKYYSGYPPKDIQEIKTGLQVLNES